ncbi:MAG: polysaccharide deacetylase family protein [Bacteroidota bacterium]|nr:polysaccharide deacetylase family protein [Bacteroidota bacterium]
MTGTDIFSQYHHPLTDKRELNRKQTVFTVDPNTSFKKIPILYYHQPPPNFEGQLRFLESFRFTLITMDNLYDYLNSRYTLPQKPVILQFDDGDANIYNNIYPILKAHHVKITLNICTYFIENRTPPPGDPTWTYNPLTWAQIQEMIDSNCVDVQSHTHNHYNLAMLTASQIDSELVISKRLLEQRLRGVSIRHIVYPFSGYNQLVMDRVKAMGYRTGRAGGNQEDGISNRQQTGMYTTIAEDPYALKVLWTVYDLFNDQSLGRICPNDNLLPEVEWAKNSDESIMGWETTLNGNGTVTFPNEGYDGGKCVKITRTDNTNQTYYISRKIPLEFNGNYVLGLRIKTDSLVTSARFQCIFWKPDLTTVAATTTYKEVNTKQDWTDYSFQFNNNGYYAVDVRVYLNNSIGTAWFDDITFKKKLSY